MDNFFAKPARIQGGEKIRPIREKIFKIPEDTGECQEYVACLKIDAPFEYYHLGGINFEKMVWPSEYSLAQNHGKVFRPKYLVFALTPKQVEAILTEAGTREVVIPATHNSKYDDRNADKEPEFLPSYTTMLSDWIILEAKDTFNFNKQEKERETKPQPPFSDIKSELLEQQKTGSKKGK